jgi:hypothetical protein
LKIKVAGGYGWQTYQLHVPKVLKYESFKLLELSGTVQAFIGFALPLLLQDSSIIKRYKMHISNKGKPPFLLFPPLPAKHSSSNAKHQ